MKKTIYILILICVLTLLPSCGESGELQENRPGFSEKDSEAEAANSIFRRQACPSAGQIRIAFLPGIAGLTVRIISSICPR